MGIQLSVPHRFGSFFLAEFVGLSGIMAIFFTGVAMSHYTVHNLSESVRISAHTMFKSLGSLAESAVFARTAIQ